MIESAPEVSAPALSVIICSQPRSGSTLLCDLLGMAGQMPRPEEWLISTFERPESSRFGMPAEHLRADYIRELVKRKQEGTGVFSVKIMGWNFGEMMRELRATDEFAGRTHAEVLAELFPRPRYISLRRKNHLSQAVSYAQAIQTDVWRKSQVRLIEDPPMVYSHLQIQQLFDCIEESENGWEHFFAHSDLDALELVYEEFVADPLGTLRTIHEWLGIAPPANEGAIRERCDRGRQANKLSKQWKARYLADEAAVAKIDAVPAFAEGSFRLELESTEIALTTIAPQALRLSVSNQDASDWLGSNGARATNENWVVLKAKIDGVFGMSPRYPFIFQELPFPLRAGETVDLELFVPTIKKPGTYEIALAASQHRNGQWQQVSNEIALTLKVDFPAYRRNTLRLFPTVRILGDYGCHVPDFGHFFDPQFPWICHDDYGWLFLDEKKSTPETLWFHDEALGWMRYQPSEPKRFFLHDAGRTVEFRRREGEDRIFTDLATGTEEAHPVRQTSD